MDAGKEDPVVSLTRKIKDLAGQVGFDACGIAKAEPLEHDSSVLNDWLVQGKHAGMDYMERYTDKRRDPRLLFPGAKSVIVLMISYHEDFYLPDHHPKVAYYALRKDYHKVIKKMLKVLLRKIQSDCAPTLKGRAFVDTAPVLEKAWARQAGLGWIGKNSLLLNEKFGSWTLLGELIVDHALAYDKAAEDRCGSCQLCLEACPAGAIVKPHSLDARKCISYLNKDAAKQEWNSNKNKLNEWVFGCDECQSICPWNNNAVKANKNIKTPGHIKELSLAEWRNLSLEKFNYYFDTTPLKSTGFDRIKSNIIQVLSQQ